MQLSWIRFFVGWRGSICWHICMSKKVTNPKECGWHYCYISKWILIWKQNHMIWILTSSREPNSLPTKLLFDVAWDRQSQETSSGRSLPRSGGMLPWISLGAEGCCWWLLSFSTLSLSGALDRGDRGDGGSSDSTDGDRHCLHRRHDNSLKAQPGWGHPKAMALWSSERFKHCLDNILPTNWGKRCGKVWWWPMGSLTIRMKWANRSAAARGTTGCVQHHAKWCMSFQNIWWHRQMGISSKWLGSVWRPSTFRLRAGLSNHHWS